MTASSAAALATACSRCNVWAMPWSDSPDYEQPIRLRDILGIIGLLLVFLTAYHFIPRPRHAAPTVTATRAR